MRKKLTSKQIKRSLVKQWKSLRRGDIPRMGRYDPIIYFVRTVNGIGV